MGQKTTTAIFRLALLGAAMTVAACDEPRGNSTEPGQPDGGPISTPVQAYQKTLKTRDDAKIVSATGDIAAALKEYRDLLGGGPNPNPNTAGEKSDGRREINWDGVPAGFTNNDALPGNFFNATSPRGVVFTTNGSGFHVSNQGFIEVNSAYAGEFNFFSPFKLFVATGSTITDINFFVAGSNTPAVVTGFGSVFEDVGRAHSTTIEYFDAAGNSLLKVAAPRRSDGSGQSFVGAVFESAVVARVRIIAGDTPIGLDAFDNVKGAGQKHDLVTMDDFIYGEPHQIRP